MNTVKQIFLNHKTLIISVLVVIAIVLTIYFVGRRAGKRKATEDNPYLKPLPDDSEKPVNATKVRQIANDLAKDLDEWDWNPFRVQDNKAYEDFLALDDTNFVAVSNDFNLRFASQFDGKSLRQLIHDRNMMGSLIMNANRDTIISRFERLNIA